MPDVDILGVLFEGVRIKTRLVTVQHLLLNVFKNCGAFFSSVCPCDKH